jgi:murein L,D-transpeptidase YcbB/YkuD
MSTAYPPHGPHFAPHDILIPRLTRRSSLVLLAAALAACDRRPEAGGTLGQGLSDPSAKAVYAARNGQPAWTGDRAKTLTRVIAGAPAHGLNPAAFTGRATPPGASPDETLTLTALSYAHALAMGFVDPRKVEKVFTLKRNEPDLAAGLAKALDGDLEGWFDNLAPTDDEYKAISAAYLAATGQGQGAESATTAVTGQARQLAANLERRRWLDRTPPEHRIDVNIATCMLAYMRPGQAPGIIHVVTGAPDHQTPCIEASFEQLVVNPPWRVPKEIAAKEILPKGAGYMAREDMHIVEGGMVEQRPGPKSSLGQVKFDLKDPYDIYLHDTPAKAWFARPERHRSHGCVRVENAVAFARSIAAETGRAEDFDKALATKDTHSVALGQTIPARLFYHTAEPGPGGQVVLVKDVYGSDDRLAEALGLGAARADAGSDDDSDTGP